MSRGLFGCRYFSVLEFYNFSPEPRLTTPHSGVGNLADESPRAVAAANQDVDQLLVAVNNAEAVHE